jgi:anti-sigma-K factor RskA
MTGPMDRLDHAAVDELGAALALGALEPDELRAVIEHLESCPEPHEEVRSFLGAGDVLAASLEPVAPSEGLRDRLMGTLAATPQEHAAAAPAARPSAGAPAAQPRRAGLFDWFSPRLARPLAVAAVVVALVFGVWNASLHSQLSDQQRALANAMNALGAGTSAFRVNGSGGQGYIVADTNGKATLLVAGVSPLEGGKNLYELWLIGSDNKPVAVGTFVPVANQLAVVPLERPISGFGVFAVTAETHRVASPTLPIVMEAKLGT